MSSVKADLERIESSVVARIRELEGSVVELNELLDLAARLDIELPDEVVQRLAEHGMRTSRVGVRGRRGDVHRPGGRRATRRDLVLELVQARPGITVPELVEELDVNRTSLYPVVRQLVSDGLIQKDGKYLTRAGG